MALGAIDLNLLVALEALLEERNVTHAGHRLCTTQSAMSGSLARLRRHFNDELLVRVGREYELTPLAERLLPLVRESLVKAEEVLALTRTFDPAHSGHRFSIVMSDYMMSVFAAPLLRAIAQEAPGVRLDVHPIVDGAPEQEEHVRMHDLSVLPLGFQLPGVSETVLSDRFVCIVDRHNPRLREGRLTVQDLGEMSHAAAGFGKSVTPIERQLETLGIRARVQASAPGFGTLPFLVCGTELVAFVPERLGRWYERNTDCVVVATPFPDVPLVEAMYWHHHRHGDLAHRWLRTIVRRVGRELEGDQQSFSISSMRLPSGSATQAMRIPGSGEGPGARIPAAPSASRRA